MSLPEGKAIYLIAFRRPLVLYTQTHRLACHPYCLFVSKNACDCFFFKILFLHLLRERKKMSNLMLNVMENYYLCSIQSKTNPNGNETVIVLVDEISDFISSNLRPDCVIIISQCSTFKAIPNEK